MGVGGKTSSEEERGMEGLEGGLRSSMPSKGWCRRGSSWILSKASLQQTQTPFRAVPRVQGEQLRADYGGGRVQGGRLQLTFLGNGKVDLGIACFRPLLPDPFLIQILCQFVIDSFEQMLPTTEKKMHRRVCINGVRRCRAAGGPFVHPTPHLGPITGTQDRPPRFPGPDHGHTDGKAGRSGLATFLHSCGHSCVECAHFLVMQPPPRQAAAAAAERSIDRSRDLVASS
ncbi:hypothetical protein C0Q70_00327 [Pomacea canaliculata]|uniref:Uncharacterized protein n=1 Tax=Pomacea canaliculata TaxID=400727 RepID=A0A2T7PWB7_POMCA|nr:hypothetical protein C0Q70_00327 [Pomacea canaliculata]